MTNKEYISVNLSRFNVSDSEVDLIIVNQNLDPNAEVDVNIAKKAMFTEIPVFIPLADLKEGGLSITWNIEAIKIWYSALAKQLGMENILNPDNDSVEDYSFMM